ncbi:hypothetical protein SPSIL_014400 [Sporomusa silvacetica DSM 10669]|uniref:Fungal lipase-type domain-containing protein n=1 Tax=Sporomusa silvacetica DSM 10669 TaxID=1123289 RepID=A0ABZ3II39_9FIRM|nr:lipase family protein [Sporomusa silvacetica]OZC21503.1 lipase (class 3) [Sporomusa silvacetica DSM 10669]
MINVDVELNALRLATLASSAMYDNSSINEKIIIDDVSKGHASERLHSLGWAKEEFKNKAIGAKWAIFSKDVRKYMSGSSQSGDPKNIIGRPEKIYIISFRGSCCLKNYITDFLKYKQSPWIESNMGNVHQGFLEYVTTVMRHPETNSLLEIIIREKTSYLIVTGHSLGGAVAILFGKWLATRRFPQKRFHVIALAPPSVGDDEFNRNYSLQNLALVLSKPDKVQLSGGESFKYRLLRAYGQYPESPPDKLPGVKVIIDFIEKIRGPLFPYSRETKILFLPEIDRSTMKSFRADFRVKKNDVLRRLEYANISSAKSKRMKLQFEDIFKETEYYFASTCSGKNDKFYYHSSSYYEAVIYLAIVDFVKLLNSEI